MDHNGWLPQFHKGPLSTSCCKLSDRGPLFDNTDRALIIERITMRCESKLRNSDVDALGRSGTNENPPRERYGVVLVSDMGPNGSEYLAGNNLVKLLAAAGGGHHVINKRA